METNSTYKSIYYPPGGILMWIIIFLELITYGLALVAFVFSGAENKALFQASATELNTFTGLVNTCFLLTSGYFMAVTVNAFKKKELAKSLFYLELTLSGGVMFCLLKSFEFYSKMSAGFTLSYNDFFTYYWILTGFHFIHVVVGLIILLFCYRAIRKNGINALQEDLEASAAFWHMCDLIWLLLFPVLYLIF